MSSTFSNRLATESSPYLLQHAHNPVDWYPWGEEALQRALKENKPLLVSIGYSACHWCHVMERESFEDPETALFMNANFVNIKIDREERPDLDHIYMDAVQAMTGSGGWPLNVFLTPQGKPFYGGTYFPPRRAYNRPSWKEILTSIADSFQSRRNEIEVQSEKLTGYLFQSNAFGLGKPVSQPDEAGFFNKKNLNDIFENIMKSADEEKGGFGKAPKFPQTFTIQFLLHFYYFTKNETALKQACLSLDKMIAGGIYDQIGGGFSRYSTDDEWLVPHFEKMLYDNALLLSVISEAYQLTLNEKYRQVMMQSADFLTRELMSPEGGFYSALDADSEGVEGKYYVWDKSEIENILGEDSGLFCEYYNVSGQGNWEGKNILHTRTGEAEFAALQNRDAAESSKKLDACRKKLLEHRRHRIAPQLDDKILLGWNALMVSALCQAYGATGIRRYKDLALRNMDFIWENFRGSGLFYFHHSFKNGRARFPAFLDDYAYLVAALIHLQEVTGDSAWLQKAKKLTEHTLENFREEGSSYFFFTHRDQKDLIIRKKELVDGATASGNAVMSFNLLYLSILFDQPGWKEMAVSNCRLLGESIVNYPTSFAVWATLLQALAYTVPEVVITGTDIEKLSEGFLSNFIPYRVFQSTSVPNDQFPLLKDKPVPTVPNIFLCRDYSCQKPVTELNEFIRLLENVQKFNE
ncbi:MAG TPA: thioredoxin domain-containing protein [Puia sp.]|nr:thioredoxin domain-containing protein [Puia sp.]